MPIPGSVGLALLGLLALGGGGDGGAAPYAAERGYWAAAVGAFDVQTEFDELSASALVEYRFHETWHHVRPAAGLVINGDDSFHLYAGLRYDWRFADDWTLTPGWSAGYFQEGNVFDLGGPIEFRTQLELARDVGRFWRVGVGIAHTSNAHLWDRNPGSDSLYLSLAYSR